MRFSAILPVALSLAAIPALAPAQDADYSGLGQTYELAQNRDYTDVVRGLEAVDYQIEDVTTTTLGRTRITANNGEHRREVIVSQTTGEVLSDMIMDTQPDADAIALQSALDAASDPRPENGESGIEFSGSLTFGFNNKSGRSAGGSVTARQEDIGGSGITGSITYGRSN